MVFAQRQPRRIPGRRVLDHLLGLAIGLDLPDDRPDPGVLALLGQWREDVWRAASARSDFVFRQRSRSHRSSP